MNNNLQTLPSRGNVKLSTSNDLETIGDNQGDTSSSHNQKMGRNKMGMMTKKKTVWAECVK